MTQPATVPTAHPDDEARSVVRFRPRRRRSNLWVVLGAILVAGVVLSLLMGVEIGPLRISKSHGDRAVSGARLAGDDSSFVMSFGGPPDECGWNYVPYFDENDTEVGVTIEAHERLVPAAGCPMSGTTHTQLVRLPHPLAGRTLVDLHRRTPIRLYDSARLLAPDGYPDRWSLGSEVATATTAEIGWARTYSSTEGSGLVVLIRDGAVFPEIANAPVQRRTTVNGNDADVVQLEGTWFVRWTQDGRLHAVNARFAGDAMTPVAEETVVQIAQSVRPVPGDLAADTAHR